LRRSDALRRAVREHVVRVDDLIAPLFVVEGSGASREIDSMPGVFRDSIPALVERCRRLADLGIPGVALFPKLEPSLKDAQGSEALNPLTLVLRAVRAVKQAVPGLTVYTDVALDPYTTHGHDGLLGPDGSVLNDPTVEVLAKMAVLQAEAGVDCVAPSDMMDGRVEAIRRALDAAGFEGTAILSYAVKYASAFYGPFRDAVGSAQSAGTHALDKRGYQMDPANVREALREARLDAEEGADILMVKPAGVYLDVIAAVRRETVLPVAAYQVSGEYAALQAAARLGWLDLERVRDESLLAIKRAGADIILTYFAEAFAAAQRR
jgi:porphobilinogen synthase